eukprot:UN04629
MLLTLAESAANNNSNNNKDHLIAQQQKQREMLLESLRVIEEQSQTIKTKISNLKAQLVLQPQKPYKPICPPTVGRPIVRPIGPGIIRPPGRVFPRFPGDDDDIGIIRPVRPVIEPRIPIIGRPVQPKIVHTMAIGNASIQFK